MMKDFAGNSLSLGDIVAYIPPNYRELCKGMVVGFSPKMITIRRDPTQRLIDYYEHQGKPLEYIIDNRLPSFVAKV